MWPGSDWLTTKAGGGENGRIEGTRRSGAWERQTVDFALLMSRRRAWATREPSRDRKWPILRPQHVHALQLVNNVSSTSKLCGSRTRCPCSTFVM